MQAPGNWGEQRGGENAHPSRGHRHKEQQLIGQPPAQNKPNRVPLPEPELSHGAAEEAQKSPGKI